MEKIRRAFAVFVLSCVFAASASAGEILGGYQPPENPPGTVDQSGQNVNQSAPTAGTSTDAAATQADSADAEAANALLALLQGLLSVL